LKTVAPHAGAWIEKIIITINSKTTLIYEQRAPIAQAGLNQGCFIDKHLYSVSQKC
jgi:hypothetical protein